MPPIALHVLPIISSGAGMERELIMQSSWLRLNVYVCMYVYVWMLSCFRNAIMYFTYAHTSTMVVHWPAARRRSQGGDRR